MGQVFVTGGTGYMGTRLISGLLAKGHEVMAVARKGSERKLPPGCSGMNGDVLNGDSYVGNVPRGCTFVHLVGVAHPSPAKAAEFESIDCRSAMEAIRVARDAGVEHFIYASVAQPLPVMKAYVDVRMRCEEALRASGLRATVLRPFYVLGPGHYWPYLLKPLYWVAERVPSASAGARRLGLVTIDQMIAALLSAVENPPERLRVVDVPAIQQSRA